MRFQLDYGLDAADYAAQHRAMDPAGLKRFRNQNFVQRVHWIVVAGAGVLASVQAKLEVLAIGLLCICLYQAVQLFLYRRHYEQLLAGTAAAQTARQVRLVVDDDGLHETTEGIESFCPWASVESCSAGEAALFVKLRAGLWSIVPRGAFPEEGSGTVDDFLALLAHKGIPMRQGAGT